ncbi:MAG: putative zinc-binding metallopeptidase [Verrucomicrobiota bacterium]
MIYFKCTCGNALFFENSICLQCNSLVGYEPGSHQMVPVSADWMQCRNGIDYGTCNWLVPTKDGPAFCAVCSLNRTVPNLSGPMNLEQWRKMEVAKRRTVYTLALLGLMPTSKLVDPEGVAFDFLMPNPGQSVITGHEDGLITLNLLEADDLYRERERHTLGEPYRTLVGHFRHELGHYYWDRFFLPQESAALLEECRALFGDERADYSAALAQHYANGPSPTWQDSHITSYASSHPWEDWAETWAQYLQIVDGVETANAFGWTSDRVPLPFTPFKKSAVSAEGGKGDATFLSTLNGWAKISPALNEIAASMGHSTINPFVLSESAVRKILFVDKMVKIASANWGKKPVLLKAKAPEVMTAAAA